jgi:hypothetical protein
MGVSQDFPDLGGTTDSNPFLVLTIQRLGYLDKQSSTGGFLPCCDKRKRVQLKRKHFDMDALKALYKGSKSPDLWRAAIQMERLKAQSLWKKSIC